MIICPIIYEYFVHTFRQNSLNGHLANVEAVDLIGNSYQLPRIHYQELIYSIDTDENSTETHVFQCEH